MKLCARCKEALRQEKIDQRGAVQCTAERLFGGQCTRRTTYSNKRCYHHGGQ